MDAIALYITLLVSLVVTPTQPIAVEPAAERMTIHFDAPIHSVPTLLR